MKVGLVGYSGSGKSTIFRWLTGVEPDPSKIQQGQTGMADVPDVRLAKLSAFAKKGTKYAAIAFLDTPGLMLDERRTTRRLGILREANGLVVVLDGFSGTDLATQLRRFREELVFADLEIVLNRIDRLTAQLKKTARPAKEREQDEAEFALLKRIQTALEAGQNAKTLGLREDEEKLIRSFQMLTLKPELAFVNAGDANASALPADLLALSPKAIAAPVKLEMELAELDEESRAAFMADLGLTGSSKERVLRGLFTGMGRIVFFTVGEDECRSWPLTEGETAVEGAGVIHTDLAKTFVRAEVMSYADFEAAGFSEKECKAKGTFRLESKDYIVQDGDIMHIRASG